MRKLFKMVLEQDRLAQLAREYEEQLQAIEREFSYLHGAAHAFDLGGTLSRPIPELPGWMEDAVALRRDWDQVGRYMTKALKDFAEKNERKAT
ncbi:MAG: hypothetical protein HY910_16730 [Desulfarculus sp.]|nr:hypothetical protein [Desulfarculus sp.]